MHLPASLIAFLVAWLAACVALVVSAVNAEEAQDLPPAPTRPQLRELSLTQRIELRLQIAHEQEEAEHHNIPEARHG